MEHHRCHNIKPVHLFSMRTWAVITIFLFEPIMESSIHSFYKPMPQRGRLVSPILHVILINGLTVVKHNKGLFTCDCYFLGRFVFTDSMCCLSSLKLTVTTWRSPWAWRQSRDLSHPGWAAVAWLGGLHMMLLRRIWGQHSIYYKETSLEKVFEHSDVILLI